ncbi:hypothetical protein DQ04_04641030, partial [Trypanosoma grayi]|uniref:hypothetical protein n=1 Tax=Trypanosoma grayi TaxID=71804 RepID=UPI0004F3FA12
MSAPGEEPHEITSASIAAADDVLMELHGESSGAQDASAATGMVEIIKELYDLRQNGALSEEEFRASKHRVLYMYGAASQSSSARSSCVSGERPRHRGKHSRGSRDSRDSRRTAS